MDRSKMTSEELKAELDKRGWSLSRACIEISNRVNTTFEAFRIQQHIDRHGTMSRSQTVSFRLLFREVPPHETA